jgi:stalled ribosome rescue protein Dom34
MSQKNKKQFGIWMDSHQATIVGRTESGAGEFAIIATEKNKGQGSNSSENAANNAERTLQQKFFREILAHMQNVEELHITGTGKEQEQFVSFLGDQAQYKNAATKQTTSNKMNDDQLVSYIAGQFGG